MLPLLYEVADKHEHNMAELIDKLAAHFKVSDEERKVLLPSGQTFLFGSRVGWARTYLKKAGLLDAPKRATVAITDRGLQALAEKPQTIDVKFLKRYSEFIAFHGAKKSDDLGSEKTLEQRQENNQTPEELLENSYLEIRRTLAQEVLLRIKLCPPAFFERLVVDLLVRMGYGGSIKDAGEATTLTNDEGIDGIIKEDKLGLDVIYIQAKRWDRTSVGRPDIQSFVGALDGKRASKGIFITTSTFADNAVEYVKTISKKVILIDGEQLAEYMLDYGLGVSTQRTFELKRIDNDYFDEQS